MTCEQWFRRELEGKFSTYMWFLRKEITGSTLQIVCHSIPALHTILNFFTLPLDPAVASRALLSLKEIYAVYTAPFSGAAMNAWLVLLFTDESIAKGIDIFCSFVRCLLGLELKMVTITIANCC